MLGQANNGARERKGLKLGDGVRTAQIDDYLKLDDIKSRRHFR
jgi:hypothetical protein